MTKKKDVPEIKSTDEWVALIRKQFLTLGISAEVFVQEYKIQQVTARNLRKIFNREIKQPAPDILFELEQALGMRHNIYREL